MLVLLKKGWRWMKGGYKNGKMLRMLVRQIGGGIKVVRGNLIEV